MNAAMLSRPSVRFGLILTLVLGVTAKPQAAEADEALKRFKVPEGFQVKLVAAEPDVRKPVSISFDDRGRMWVIQYLQYPTPAGLKPVKVDQYLRTVYDRIPEPPPKGPKGIDRITILSDPDATGRYRKVKDFHVGLNLASGFALGHGGIFVAQPPYLLFYKIKDGADVPAGDPEVLLSGFGMEDAHAFPNSLQWGPDGWLYGAQGSTVTANIRGIEFQQGIWRYHPVTKEFELFAEGGGNTWGVDFDRHGQIIAGTNWGGQACLHQVQGGYYVKGFSKHGPLHNPYTFGYFDHIPYKDFKGGHVTCGGIVYQGGAFPKQYHNQYIAGNLLSSAIHWHILERKGSSFTARHGGELMTTDDPTFRPVDCLTGPDGALYIADWCDKRANHVDPVDNWDRTRGRIWKLEYVGTQNEPKSDLPRPGPQVTWPLSKLSSQDLLPLLWHRNSWYRGEARRILAERRDKSIMPALKKLVQENKDQLALEALWALYVSGGMDALTAEAFLGHPNEDVRAWTVRLLGDRKIVSQSEKLVGLAQTDPSPRVRSQLACTAKRLTSPQCLAIVQELIQRPEDMDDPHIPMLLWWAIEDKAVSDRKALLAMLARGGKELWRSPIVEKFIAERLARRYMAGATRKDYEACHYLIGLAHDAENVGPVVAGMEKALEGRQLAQPPKEIAQDVIGLWLPRRTDSPLLRLAVRLGHAPAYDFARDRLGDAQTPPAERLALLDLLGQIGKPDCVPLFLKLFRESPDAKLRAATLTALQRFPDPAIAAAVLEQYPKLTGDLRNRAQTLLTSRPGSTLDFLKLVDAGKVDKKDVPLDVLQRVVLYKDEAITKLVEKHWGKIGAQTSGEKQSRMRSVESIVRRGKGDPGAGKELFTKNCATCHVLFGEGNKVGPELTGVDRKNLTFLVHSIVDPSEFIRPEFVAFTVATKDGRVLTGLVAEDSPKAVTLLDAKNERTVVARDSIEEMTPSPQSLMPEKLLDALTDQQICDLFAYLQGNGSGAAKPQAAAPLKVLLISGSLEYKSDQSLAELQKFLEAQYNVKCLRAFRKTDSDLPGLEQLDACDVALFFTRRLTIEGEQLERIQKYCQAGKPIVALRTASHGFQKWLAMDKEVFGGNYGNHYKEGPPCAVKLAPKAKDSPLLQGVREFTSVGSLYKNPDIARDCEVLLTGSIPEHTEPVAWTRVHNGGRVFYTSLGHPKDFEDESFRRLVVNALFWTAKREVQKK